MLKYLIFLGLLVNATALLRAQDSVRYRVLLIGDAGEITPEQKLVLQDVSQNAIGGKTLALFLGDNVYPRGMELPGDDKAPLTEDILRSQYEGLRKAGVPVYFVPGNHDWDKSGPKGLQKMTRFNQFIAEQQDPQLQIIPADACPGPYELSISDNLVIVAMDSEWWLYPFERNTEETDCECKTKREILGKLHDMLMRNRNKVVLFATHHPFRSHGSHGGYHTVKDHVFPFTNLNKNLYIPLPIIGSLYPILRNTFPPAEDLKNVLYEDMISNIEDLLKLHPNVIHVSGHEHAMQLIQGTVLELVSGSGAKYDPVKDGKQTLYARAASGYVIADLMPDNSVRLNFRAYNKGVMENAFSYDRPYSNAPGFVEQTPGNLEGNTVQVKLNEDFDKVSRMHRRLFGENYRKVWAMETTIPVLRISEAGLKPTEVGGGMQTRSLRFIDNNKQEWVVRSVEKFPDNLLPQSLTNTLAADILKDNSTAALPYGPLTVGVFADAVGVPHSHPKIVYIAPDTSLRIYSKYFANTVALFEEREPLGKSLSTAKMQAKLADDNDNKVNQEAFLRARLLDIFLGDWDRHADQWRWVEEEQAKTKLYKPIPRDRDQVFYVNQGLFPKLAALPWVMPKFQGFDGKIRNINTFSFNARLIDGLFTNELSYADWMKHTEQETNAWTETVIDSALRKLPDNVYEALHSDMSSKLMARKQDMLLKMPRYYEFLNKIVDIQASNKNELIRINDTLDGNLSVSMYKLSKNREPGKLIYSRLLDPSVTKEIRLFLLGGNDSVYVHNNSSPIKVRMVGDASSPKSYHFDGSSEYLRKVHVYDGESNAAFTGGGNGYHQHLSNDPANTEVQVTNRYNKKIPMLNVAYNVDDGFIFGGGGRSIAQGFRKNPYGNAQQFNFAYSFSSGAFRVLYKAEWINAIGKADLLLLARVLAPNTQNFFGRGNETPIDKTGDYKTYYRTRFSLYHFAPALRWRSGKANSFSMGPVVQYYSFAEEDNNGRFIKNSSELHSYDSTTVEESKGHGGLIFDFTRDSRNNVLLPTFGTYLNLRAVAYAGLNDHSKSYSQLVTEIAVYRNLDRKANVILANRIGGGVTGGKTTFYQSLFLGGHENLRGFNQYRFAGEQMVYNNLELRIKVANLASYLLPGQLGILGFYDIGRVWEKGEYSKKWHQGTGGGIYFAPAQMVVFEVVLGSSTEGLYPYFTMGWRF